MTGFEPGSSCIVSDRSANCATTTSQLKYLFVSHSFSLNPSFFLSISFIRLFTSLPSSVCQSFSYLLCLLLSFSLFHTLCSVSIFLSNIFFLSLYLSFLHVYCLLCGQVNVNASMCMSGNVIMASYLANPFNLSQCLLCYSLLFHYFTFIIYTSFIQCIFLLCLFLTLLTQFRIIITFSL